MFKISLKPVSNQDDRVCVRKTHSWTSVQRDQRLDCSTTKEWQRVRTTYCLVLPFYALTDERSDGVQFRRPVTAHFMEVVVLGKAAALATQVV